MGKGSFDKLVSYLSLYGLELFSEKQLTERNFNRKSQLIDEYNQLIFERQKLMKKVQMLDYRIQRKEAEIHSCDIEREKSLVRVKGQ